MADIPEKRTLPLTDDAVVNRLHELRLQLPEVPAPLAAYVNCVRSGNLLYLSGGLPITADGMITGKVPTDISLEQAQEAARLCILNRLAVIKSEIGSLEKVKQIVSLNGFVNSQPDYYDHPQVINGASKLLVEVFGEKGKHSRTALGAAALPLNASVEINLIVEVED